MKKRTQEEMREYQAQRRARVTPDVTPPVSAPFVTPDDVTPVPPVNTLDAPG